MKTLTKIAVLLFLVVLIQFSSSYAINTMLQKANTASQVYLVKVYQKDPIRGNYTLAQLGSAVSIDKQTLITNAHVIINSETNEPYKYIEVCQTQNIKKDAVCFTTATTKDYNTDDDLAALLVVNGDLIPSIFDSKDPEVKNKVSVIGYPNNGGFTITTTQGVIAGYKDGHYKIDANIDHGNSGGGAYNDAGQLVGIPVFVTQGESSLGYIIPNSTIKKFIASLKSADSGSVDSKFASYVFDIQSQLKTQIIKNLYFSLSLKKSGFKITSISFDKSKGVYNYDLLYKDNKSLLNISINANDNTLFDSDGNDEYLESVRKSFSSVNYSTSSIGGQQREYLANIKSLSDKKTSVIIFDTNIDSSHDLTFTLITESPKDSIKLDVLKLVKNLKFATTTVASITNTMGSISLPSSSEHMRKYLDIDRYGNIQAHFDIFGRMMKGGGISLVPIDEQTLGTYKDLDISIFKDKIIKNLKDRLSTLVVKKQGFVQSNSSKRLILVLDCSECNNHNVYAYTFVKNGSDNKTYLVVFNATIALDKTTILDTNKILNYISQFSFTSNIPYKTDGIVFQSFEDFIK